MAHKLVIVESPAKARTIGGYLGDGYVVESSIGHIRDLPQSAADTPAKIKDKPWGRLAVDVENDFEPYYVVPRDKKSHISKLKGLLKDADELYLATDEDREGEAIAWHLLDELKPKDIPVKRMVFHEITKAAIQAAAENPRELDMDLVEAQEARRILDRLYGYEVSPVLWKKVMSGLSAGRVQSVATRLVVDRERERMRFRVASYWDLEGTFDAEPPVTARSSGCSRAGCTPSTASGWPRAATSARTASSSRGADVVHLDRTRAEGLVTALADTTYDVRSVESKPYRRSPYAPFRTTTMQQEASRKLGMSASVTMSVAQRLYENGFITYMRTDSTTLSGSAVNAARSQVRELYGAEYLPDAPRTYASKVKNAQEAHEAIRPAGESFRTPAQTGLTGEQFRLYELIWMRTVASQMKDATGQSVSIRLGGAAPTGEDVVFSASGRVITFHGFLKAYVEGTDEGGRQGRRRDAGCRRWREGDPVSAAALSRVRPRDQAAGALHRGDADQGARGARDRPPVDVRLDHRHHPQPRLRLQEGHRAGAGLAGVLGDPAAGGALPAAGRPTSSPRAWRTCSTRSPPVTRTGSASSSEFYYGSDSVPGSAHAGHRARRHRRPGARDVPDRRPGLRHRPAGRPLRALPRGPRRRGQPRGQAGQRARGPAARRAHAREGAASCSPTRPARRSSSARTRRPGCRSWRRTAASGPTSPRCCPRTRPRAPSRAPARCSSRCRWTRSPSTTRSSCCRCRGWSATDPESGEEITAQNGRYGPYLKKGTDSRSLTSEDQLFTITLDEALTIYAQPKQRGRAAAAPPLKELGNDPVSGQPVVVKSGRFGEYVTDGEYNATLRKDDTVEAITLERAAELLAERRARGPAKKAAKKTARRSRPRRRRRRRPQPRSAAKKTLTSGPLWRRSAPPRRFSA